MFLHPTWYHTLDILIINFTVNVLNPDNVSPGASPQNIDFSHKSNCSPKNVTKWLNSHQEGSLTPQYLHTI